MFVAASVVNKKLSKVKYCSKGHLLRYQKAYFNNLQVNRWLHLSTSLWGNPVCSDLLSKRIDQKNFPFMATINWIVLALWWSAQYCFPLNSLIFGKSLDEGRKQIARQLKSCMFYKQMQKADAHLWRKQTWY